ncbi:MAG: IclR family transcriptional regulator [Jatrophihabitans sp.]
MRQHSGIGVIDKTVSILDAVAEGPAALADLVSRTGLPRATAHRLAVALEAHQFLGRDGDGRFILGPRLGQLAGSVTDVLIDAAAPALAWLRDETGESAQLYRREGRDRVCIAAAERSTGLRTTVPVGAHLPLTAGSGAQVLCAWEDPDAVADVLAVAQFTPRQLTDVRRRGWAQSIGQREAGVTSVSAPVFRVGAVVAAISISGPIERLGRAPGARFAPTVVSAARRLSAALPRG